MTDTTKYAVRAIVGARKRKIRILTGFDAVKTYGDSITGTGIEARIRARWKKTRIRRQGQSKIDVWICEDLLSTVPFKIVAIRAADYEQVRP